MNSTWGPNDLYRALCSLPRSLMSLSERCEMVCRSCGEHYACLWYGSAWLVWWWVGSEEAYPQTSTGSWVSPGAWQCLVPWARVCRQFPEDEGIDTIDWPPHAPDLTPVEHLWNIMFLTIRCCQVAFQSLAYTGAHWCPGPNLGIRDIHCHTIIIILICNLIQGIVCCFAVTNFSLLASKSDSR